MTKIAGKMIVVAALFVLILAASAGAESSASLGLKASTLGAGVELGSAFSDTIGGRIGFNYFTYDYKATEEQIRYDFDLKLQSFSAILDWHPSGGAFKISAGALINSNKIDGTAVSSSTYQIGDVAFPGAAVGHLKSNVDFNDVAPYLGIGWDTTFSKKKGLGITFELGAIYQGSPNVKLSADGPIVSDPIAGPIFLTELAKEEKKLQDDFDPYKFYPVVSLGLVYRF